MKFLRIVGVPCLGVASLLLVACSGVSSGKYYSLSPQTGANTASLLPLAAEAEPTPSAASAEGAQGLRIMSVDVPAQVDRSQLVLSTPPSTELILLNDSQWAAPLGEDIRFALGHYLSRELGVVDLSLGAGQAEMPVWVFNVTVQGFELVYGQYAQLGLGWRLMPQRLPGQSAKACQATIRVPVQEAGVEALVAGQREALAIAAGVMAAATTSSNWRSDQRVSDARCASLAAAG